MANPIVTIEMENGDIIKAEYSHQALRNCVTDWSNEELKHSSK